MSSNQLPPEILEQIFAYISASRHNVQQTLHTCSLVSRSWYSNSIRFLYDSPIISGKNYDPFVRAICPSVNAHVRVNGLADLVKKLDMSNLVHNGSKSLTARILGRVKGSLEKFVAPQASFAINCLAALSKCTNLRHLDLSFVSESIAMNDLLRSTSHLSKLESLHLPRSSVQEQSRKNPPDCEWPSKLSRLYVSGLARFNTLPYFKSLPPSLSHLSLQNLPHMHEWCISAMLDCIGPNLHTLRVLAPIPSLQKAWPKPANYFLDLCPHLTYLKISVDLIDDTFFVCNLNNNPPSLTRLDLHCFDPAESQNITPASVYNALGNDLFTKVRIVGAHRLLEWHTRTDYQQDMFDMDDLLKALAREDGPKGSISEKEAGSVFFRDS